MDSDDRKTVAILIGGLLGFIGIVFAYAGYEKRLEAETERTRIAAQPSACVRACASACEREGAR